ncbi:hypothetical protein [Caproiciproducens sp.]|uniref:hypothetical protein n=1 Tax=Caproiciproducens sp. TaxID=1954376 RepID=UPI002899C5F0|nr:hypothetical protein [Caproiciproducens sp.]
MKFEYRASFCATNEEKGEVLQSFMINLCMEGNEYTEDNLKDIMIEVGNSQLRIFENL